MKFEHIKGKTILLTGATGYIGSHLLFLLLKYDCLIIVLTRRPIDSSFGTLSSTRVRFIVCDLLTFNQWEDLFNNTVDIVFHLAAFEHRHGSVSNAELDEKINTQVTEKILSAIVKKKQASKFVFTSTTGVYGNPSNLPVNESSPVDPITVFAQNKLNSEMIIQRYSNQEGVNSVCLRLPNIFGWSAGLPVADVFLNTNIHKMIVQAIKTSKIKLFRNSACVRDFVNIHDLVDALLNVASPDVQSSLLLISSNMKSSLESVAEFIKSAVSKNFNKECHVFQDDTVSLDVAEMRNYMGDSSLIMRTTGWRPNRVISECEVTQIVRILIKSKELLGH